ncbi:MAG: SagB/ThcOx family dehydrogenase [Elusimicrobia bacterium]|nr:SagB/ThcOx family dehydrogenase [Elusimicrobiota bacterium]
MRTIKNILAFLMLFLLNGIVYGGEKDMTKLPPPSLKGKISLEETISKRRSVRNFEDKKLSIEQISQILWSAQGITDSLSRKRSAPSAGAVYPIKIYLVSPDGFFLYVPENHSIQKLLGGDLRNSLASEAYGQYFINAAGASIVIASDYDKIMKRYGSKAVRYCDMEAGHIAQNVHLEAVALGLASVPVGAFDENGVKRLFRLPENEEPVYIIPVGYQK